MQCLLCDHEFERSDPPELFVEIVEHAEAEHPDQADLFRGMWDIELDEAKDALETETDQDRTSC